MDNVFEINNDFNFNDINLANPVPLTGGSFFTKLSVGNYSKNLYLQLPKATTKQGIMKNSSKMYCDLMFNSNQKDLIEWLEKFENFCQNSILQKKELWFHNDINLQDIEELMNPIMRSYRSGKYFLVRTHIKNLKCVVYDENENIINLEKLNINDEIIPLINLDGIRFSSKTFQIEINLIQMMILVPQIEFEKNCLIKIKKNLNVHNKNNNRMQDITNKTNQIMINVNDTDQKSDDNKNINDNENNVDENDNVNDNVNDNDNYNHNDDNNDNNDDNNDEDERILNNDDNKNEDKNKEHDEIIDESNDKKQAMNESKDEEQAMNESKDESVKEKEILMKMKVMKIKL